MSWGDSWGETPCANAIRLAKAFWEGRPLGGSGPTRVELDKQADFYSIDYVLCGSVIARHSPESCHAAAVIDALEGHNIKASFFDEPVFRCMNADKATARHLRALGLDAECQWGNRPFLICGANASNRNFRTLAEWQALPKWVPPEPTPKVERAPRFVNLTLPLFT